MSANSKELTGLALKLRKELWPYICANTPNKIELEIFSKYCQIWASFYEGRKINVDITEEEKAIQKLILCILGIDKIREDYAEARLENQSQKQFDGKTGQVIDWLLDNCI